LFQVYSFACGRIACHQIGIKPVIPQDHTKEFAIGAGPVCETDKILPVFLKQRQSFSEVASYNVTLMSGRIISGSW
jgi:hypothetical protein